MFNDGPGEQNKCLSAFLHAHMTMPPAHKYFSINTDRESYRTTHPHDTTGDPFRFWLTRGFGFMTPTPKNIADYRDMLSRIRPGDMLFAYESKFRRGFVACGVALEHWDGASHQGGVPELYRDPTETYFQIKVAWNAGFSCSLDELQSAGFGSPGSTIMQIQKEENYNFLLGRLAAFEARRDALKASLEKDQTGASSATPLASRREARDRLAAAVAAAEAAPNDGRDDPLQLLWNDRELPATAVFSLPPGAPLSANDLLAVSLAGASLQSAPDPVDSELDALMLRDDLSTETRREVSQRIGQGKFRAALLQLFGRCAVTGVTTREVLRAAHIHRWADCVDTPADRRNTDNGLLLTATIDALFEAGLITFGDDGRIAISQRLSADAQSRLGIHAQMRLSRAPSARQRMYLEKHRERTRAFHEVDDIRVAVATS